MRKKDASPPRHNKSVRKDIRMIQIDQNSKQPLYVQIMEGIRNGIREGRFEPGERLPNERDLAKQLGVSTMAVGMALSALVDEGLIYQRPQRGTIIADIDPTDVARSKSHNIGVIFTNILGVFMEDIVKGVQSVLHEMDYQMFLCDCNDKIDEEVRHVNSLIDKGVDGLIIFPVYHKRGTKHRYSHYRRLQQARIPFVLIDRYHKKLSTDYVVFDNYGWAYRAARQLVDDGHERIGYVSGALDVTSVVDRLRGYKAGMKDAGIQPDESLIEYYIPGESSLEEITKNLIDRGSTAIMCWSGAYPDQIRNIIVQSGMADPDGISLVDVSSALAEARQGAVTELPYQMGKRAADVLFRKMAAGGVTEMMQVVLGMDFVPRPATVDDAVKPTDLAPVMRV